MWCFSHFILILLIVIPADDAYRFRRREKCPKVKAMRNFELSEMMGFWYVIQYFASTEEAPEYSCMRSVFDFSYDDLTVTMNFTYIYADDPLHELQQGNITWIIPNFATSAHWVHTEDIYEGIYNTYIIDTDYKTWALIMHCAEKSKDPPRYLSALLMSRESHLGINVINFLREKLPRYDIDISFMFPIDQEKCDESGFKSTGLGVKQPMKVIHK
ncbi:Karl [Sergentomyia squamirostris]